MLDSKKFCNACEQNEYDPRTVATHIVFLGSAVMHKVLENGIYDDSVAKDLDLYKDEFFPQTADEFAKKIRG